MMRIIRANIFGFGQWVDYSLEMPKEGPVFIYGENESGKSTFHQFILFMLFGMPPKQRKYYQPKTSSKLGGQLVLYDSYIGEFTIERFDDKYNGAAICFMDSGETFDESWLKERLKGMNPKTFAAIFSFSALDLNHIQQMDEEDLGEVLLSIGLTGSDHIYQVEKQLDARLSELFRPQGKNPIINKQLQQLNDLAEQLQNNLKEEASYRKKHIEAERLLNHLEELQLEKQEAEREKNYLSKQRTALPVIQEYQYLILKQQDYLEELAFPENGLERLEKIKDELRPLESELAVLKDNQSRSTEQLKALEKQRISKDVLQEIKDKQQAAERYIVLENHIAELQTKQAALKKDIAEELDYLHINLSHPDLDEIALPFYIEETWKQLKSDKEMLALESANLQSEERGLIEEQKYLENELNYQVSTLLSDEKAATMKNKLNQGKEYAQLERLHEASIQKGQHFEKEKEQKLKGTNRIFRGSMLLFAVGMIAAYFTDQRSLYGLSFIIFIIGVTQWFLTKQNIKQLERMLQSPITLERKEQLSPEELLAIERQLKEEADKHDEMERLQTALESQNIKLLKWAEKNRIFLEKDKRYLQQLEEQYTLYPYLKQINLSYWPEYYQRLKSLLKWNEEYNQTAVQINDMYNEQKQLKKAIISSMGMIFLEKQEKDIVRILADIQNLLKVEQETKQRISHYNEMLSEVHEKIHNLEKRMSVYTDEMNQLFAIAHTNSEEEFYKRANAVAEKAKLESALEMTKRQLDTAFPNNTWKVFIHEQFDALELQQLQEALEVNITSFDGSIEASRTQLAEINAELKRLESSDAHSEKIHQFEIEKEKLNRLAKEWAMIKAEKEVLAETKENYRDKYLAKVMEETAHFLNTVTAGKYVSVYSPENKEPFRLMAADGLRFTVNELSQGTMNQLYVSLRLAISKVMAESHQLPFLLDDAFVHFDEVRVKRMIKVLAETAAEQQVIMFTCKNDVRDACEQLHIRCIEL